MIIHPLYVELQNKSPLGFGKDYVVDIIDKKIDGSISELRFYNEYVTESLPVILRNNFADKKIIKDIQEKKSD